jgi:hypothetical protein
VKKVLAGALASGYSGSFTIEPHMASVFHDTSVKTSPEHRFETFVRYGRRTEDLFRELGFTIRNGAVYPDGET